MFKSIPTGFFKILFWVVFRNFLVYRNYQVYNKWVSSLQINRNVITLSISFFPLLWEQDMMLGIKSWRFAVRRWRGCSTSAESRVGCRCRRAIPVSTHRQLPRPVNYSRRFLSTLYLTWIVLITSVVINFRCRLFVRVLDSFNGRFCLVFSKVFLCLNMLLLFSVMLCWFSYIVAD